MPALYTQHDIDLSNDVRLELSTGLIKFQFPPRVLSDSRRGTWQDSELRGVEPVAVFATSGAREISLSWTYIVDGGKWSVDTVVEQVRMIRGYFAQVRKANNTRDLIVKFKMWSIGGPLSMTCRIVAIDVKHGETIVGSGDDAFHLRTDIVVELRIWTQGSDANDKVAKVDGLADFVSFPWY